jgi:hypothetical protein
MKVGNIYKILKEPELAFSISSSENAFYPAQGLANYGPLDFNVKTRDFEEIRLAIISEKSTHGHLIKTISGLNTPANPTRIFPPYAGFENIYKAKLAIDEASNIKLEKNDVNSALSSSDPFADVIELYKEKIDSITSSPKKFDVLVIFIPRDFEPFVLSNGRDLRAHLKALCVQKRVYSQILRSHNFNPSDIADFRWNLSLGFYVAAKGEPWRLWDGFTGTTFLGISFGLQRENNDVKTLVGIAEIFDKWGISVSIKSVNEEYSVDRGFCLSKRKMKQLIKEILRDYKEETKEAPSRLVIHKTTEFTEEEKRGVLEIVGTKTEVELLHILEKSDTLLFPNVKEQKKAGFPPFRGTFWPLDKSRFVIYTSGYIEDVQTYPGQGTPRLLEIGVCHGGKNLEGLASEIFALTKMNWNTMRPMIRKPVTLTFSDRIVKIIKTGLVLTQELRDFRLYV